MKQAKKIISAVLALTMVSAIAPMSVYAGTITESDEIPKTDGDFKVSYTYTPEPTYTVTIPAGVTLSDDEATTADITAEGVENLGGKKINVELTSGTYTTEGSTFHAKNGDSVVTYTISKGNEMISVGDIVAEFESNGSQTLTFSKPDKSNATVAGEHTENLTFTVSVEDVFPIGLTFQVGDTVNLGDNVYVKDYDVAREMSGDYTLEYLQYDYGRHAHNYKLVRGDEKTYFAVSNSYNIRPTAVKVTGGTGTSTDPYTFTAVYAENVSQIGTTFHKGDTVNLGYDIYVLDIHGQSMLIAGDYSVSYSSYNYEMEGHIYYLKGYNKAYILAADKSDKEPTGVTVTGGSGTETDPYTFTAVH